MNMKYNGHEITGSVKAEGALYKMCFPERRKRIYV